MVLRIEEDSAKWKVIDLLATDAESAQKPALIRVVVVTAGRPKKCRHPDALQSPLKKCGVSPFRLVVAENESFYLAVCQGLRKDAVNLIVSVANIWGRT
jgi:hypothetical protein